MDDSKTSAEQPVHLSAMNSEELANMLGWDTQRIWATGVQAFRAPDHVMLVFREQFEAEDGDGKKQLVARNVGSVVMPLNVAKSFQKVLANVMKPTVGEKASEGAE